MTQTRGLVDTNVVIRLAELDRRSLPDVSLISAITLAELTVGPLVAQDPGERALRQSHVQLAEADFDTIDFDAKVARAYGTIAANLRGVGRKSSARAFDALIAATALAHNLPLYTANPDDFAAIAGLDVHEVREASR